MTSIDRLLAKGRGATVEFVPEPEARPLAELIVAFANSVGGTIVLGVDEVGRVHVDATEDLEPILARALRLCEPPFRAVDLPEWRTEETPKGQVTTISVKPTPYRLSVAGREVFVRSGTMVVRLSPDEAAASHPATRAQAFEDETVPGATVDDFDEEVIEEYQRNRIKRGPRGEALTRTELLRDAGAINVHGLPTAAGILLFGRHPERFYPQVGVIVVRFKGTSIREAVASTERYSRRVEIVGPAARVIERTWEALFEEIHRQPLMKGLTREEQYEYPLEAVREAVVNSVCHRDYSIIGQRIEIRLFDDRMEIMSPGGLPGHMTLDSILDEHYSRNPRLVRGLYCWGYIEELGQGIDIIYEALNRHHHPPPEFRDAGRAFSVTLSNVIDEIELQYGDEFSPRQLRALKYLASHDRITNSDYRELCPEVSTETVRLDLRALVERGLLLKIGDKRGTYYVRK